MAKIEIISGGVQSLIQDLGRVSFQKMGMPVTGVMDNYAARCANILVDNPENAALIESALLGPEIKFLDRNLIAITGANMLAEINGVKIKNWKSYLVNSGDILKLHYAAVGMRSYIAFSGGIDVPLLMGSYSTYLKGSIGGFNGRALKSGDMLSTHGCTEHRIKEMYAGYIPAYSNQICLRAVPGPHTDFFSADGYELFFAQTYTVDARSDRMGIFLQGSPIDFKNETADILSSAILMGSIQVTNDATPVILMADCQTTGGYAQIATVISADLPKIAQAKAGDKISFKSISVHEAQNIYKEYEQKIITIKAQLGSGLIAKSSHTKNLKLNGNAYRAIIEEVI